MSTRARGVEAGLMIAASLLLAAALLVAVDHVSWSPTAPSPPSTTGPP